MAGRASPDENAIRTERKEKGLEAFEVKVENASHTRDVLDSMFEKRHQGRIDLPGKLGDPENWESGQEIPEAPQTVEEAEPERSGLSQRMKLGDLGPRTRAVTEMGRPRRSRDCAGR